MQNRHSPFFNNAIFAMAYAFVFTASAHANSAQGDPEMLLNIANLAANESAPVPTLLAFAPIRERNDELLVAPPSNKFFSESKLNFILRSQMETLQLARLAKRNTWVLSGRLGYESGFTEGPLGFGLDTALYGASQLAGGEDVRNLAHVKRNGTSSRDKTWEYIGEYALKMRFSWLSMKFGLQQFSNPFLTSFDNRPLPPNFRGLSVVGTPTEGWRIKAGSVSAVYTRGADFSQRLITTNGLTFDRLSYIGAEWDQEGNRKVSLYASRANDLWNQYYASAAQSFGGADGVKWTGKADIYYTKNQGASLQGDINNTAYSVSLMAQRQASSLLFAYQYIDSNQLFDYARETMGMYLENSMGADYSAPHEKSLQLRYKYDGKKGGLPGVQLSLWGVYGYGVDGTVGAAQHRDLKDPVRGLYWKNGKPISGGNREIGMRATYIVQQGQFKNLKTSLFCVKHKSDPTYPSLDFLDVRLTIEMPILVF